MSAPAHVFVVTCRVPPGSGGLLRVEVEAGKAIAVTPSGFRHTFELPPDTEIESLEWQVYADVLELRAPYRGT